MGTLASALRGRTGLSGRARRAAALTIGLSGALALLLPAAAAAATPADRAATRAYLQAGYELAQTRLSDAAATQSTVANLESQLGGECHGVLAGAPREGPLAPVGEEPPRARGERERSKLQLHTIEYELALVINAAGEAPYRAAVEAYAAKVVPLSWSNPQIGRLIDFETGRAIELLTPPVGDLCAEMQAWAHSGYHILPTASREFAAKRSAEEAEDGPGGSLDALLKPYEGAGERELLSMTMALRVRLRDALAPSRYASAAMEQALGLEREPFGERETQPLLGHGSTRGGSSFTVRGESANSSTGSAGSSCPHSVSVELERQTANGESRSSSSSVCLGAHADHEPSSECYAQGESIVAAVAPSVTTVRLLLSDRHTITSRVVHIPRSAGGPAGVYVQAVRNYRPYPVSLTELDRRGRVVLVLALRPLRCSREPAVTPPRSHALVTGTTPGGEAFVIEGSVFRDELSLELNARGAEHEEGANGQSRARAFRRSLAAGCPPHEFAILYGILAAPGASVLARTSAGLVALSKVALARHLHAGGPLVYGVFATMPAELIVRRSNGSTLYTESLAANGAEEAEFCRGFAEA